MRPNADNSGAALRKKETRIEAAARRDALPPDSRAALSAAACKAAAEWLSGRGIARSGSAIMAYAPFRSELDTAELIEWAWQSGIAVVLPRCIPENRSMELYMIRDWNELAYGAYGIREPDPAKARRCGDEVLPDAVFVPGLAFDSEGGRLGYGGGYYDRFRDRAEASARAAQADPPPWIGLGFEAQWLGAVPMEEHDARVDAVITERGFYPTWSKAD